MRRILLFTVSYLKNALLVFKHRVIRNTEGLLLKKKNPAQRPSRMMRDWRNIFEIAFMALLFLSFAPGGSIKSDLIQINKKMFEAKTYRASARVVFNYVGQDKSSIARSARLNELFTYSYQDYTFLSNKKFQVMVNRENKTILVQDNEIPDDDGKRDFSQYEKMMDSVLAKNYTYTAVKTQGNYQTIKTHFKADELYESLELTYDSKNFCFKSFDYVCGKKLRQTGLERIRVIYDEFNFNPGLSEKEFSEEKYIVTKGKKIVGPSEKYKGYTVIDQRLDP